MEPLPDYPGLQTRDGYFERAYRVGPDVARVRFAPQRVESGLTGANIAALPKVLAVHMSASLVDADGQVLTIAGQGCFQEPQSHVWQVDDGAPFDMDGWLTEQAAIVVAKLLNAASVWRAAEQLIPPVAALELQAAPDAISMDESTMVSDAISADPQHFTSSTPPR